MEKICETCENKDICRYTKDICDKIKRIEAIVDGGDKLLTINAHCKKWRGGEVREMERRPEIPQTMQPTYLGDQDIIDKLKSDRESPCCGGSFKEDFRMRGPVLYACGDFKEN